MFAAGGSEAAKANSKPEQMWYLNDTLPHVIQYVKDKYSSFLHLFLQGLTHVDLTHMHTKLKQNYWNDVFLFVAK